MDTIFAVSSGRPPAAIAVLRISGPHALAAATALATTLPPPRRAGLRHLRAPDGSLIDQALVLTFPGPATATGEDLVEFHLHGGRAVVAAAEKALGDIPGLRPALAGEFTRRALANGRIDLIQAQGIADLLEAETEQQHRLAIESSEGKVSQLVHGWMAELSRLAALVEAAIDFDDEDDVSDADNEQLDRDTEILHAQLGAVLARPSVERYREGIRIVLVGPTNAGKSSLFNALLGRDAAIVSPIAGTTRDRVEASVTRRGQVYTLVDTAGVRDDRADPIERIGIDRALQARAAADIVLDLGEDAAPDDRTIVIHARSDARSDAPLARSIVTSCADLTSIDRLWDEIDRRANVILVLDGAPTFHRFQQDQIRIAATALRASLASQDLLLRAEELRTASRALASLLGMDATEAMLDALFSRFCVGK